MFTNLTLDLTLFANGTSTEDYVEIPLLGEKLLGESFERNFAGTLYYKPLSPQAPFNPRVEATFVELPSSEDPMLRV